MFCIFGEMKKAILLSFFFMSGFFVFAQDTVKVYPVRMAINKKSKYKADTTYLLGKKIISKEMYNTLALPENWILKMPHPIFVKYYSHNLRLREEYLVHYECKCGIYRYYDLDDGKLRIEGQYCPIFAKINCCNKKIGIWKYYNAKGEIIGTENFDEEPNKKR